MSLQPIITEVKRVFKRWFHKRSIIVMSEHKVKHIPIGVQMQVCAVAVVAAFVCWASYSTGSFVAARHALKEQSQTLRLFTSVKVETAFNPNPLFKSALLGRDDSVFTPESKISRMAYLENKVNQLQHENTLIIKRVQEKTAGRIDDLESIIKQTGLDADKMTKIEKANEGGPYIPSDSTQASDEAQELFSDLEELVRLHHIVNAMPLSSPIKGATEQSGFGHRFDPFNNHLAFHSGLDLAGPVDSKVFATADGLVSAAERDGSYGNMVDIEHSNGLSTRYGHLSEILVNVGNKVHKGDIIGIQGSTGRSTGPHLHYEVRYNDQPMNPKNFLQAGHYVSQE
jgi:murein DD-endopeptidase MepM/ murein hydrolase activator NlpD